MSKVILSLLLVLLALTTFANANGELYKMDGTLCVEVPDDEFTR